MKNDSPVMHEEEILSDFDLKGLLLRCWELRRKVAVFAVFFSVACFALFFWAGRQYSSEGFMRAPRKFAEYNAQKAAFWDRETLRRYLDQNKKLDDPNGR